MPTLEHNGLVDLFRENPGLAPDLLVKLFDVEVPPLREPMRRALEALIMERQSGTEASFPPFAQQLIERGEREGILKGKREGIVEGKRDALLQLVARAGIPLAEGDRARIEACTDAETLDRWVGNVLKAKTAADVLS